MQNFASNSARAGGVRLNNPVGEGFDDNAPTGQPRRVLQVAPLKYYAVQHTDDSGVLHNTVVLVIGGKVYFPPSHEEWSKQLTGAREWFQKEFTSVLEAQQGKQRQLDGVPVAPPRDAVDVFEPGETSASAEETAE